MISPKIIATISAGPACFFATVTGEQVTVAISAAAVPVNVIVTGDTLLPLVNVTNFVAGDGVTFVDEAPDFDVILLGILLDCANMSLIEDAAEDATELTDDVVSEAAMLLVGPVSEIAVLLTDPAIELLLAQPPGVIVTVFVSV